MSLAVFLAALACIRSEYLSWREFILTSALHKIFILTNVELFTARAEFPDQMYHTKIICVSYQTGAEWHQYKVTTPVYMD